MLGNRDHNGCEPSEKKEKVTMRKETAQTKFVWIVLGLLLFAMMAPLVASPQTALAKGGGDTPRHQGLVQSKPAARVVGTWVVGGKTFRATAGTEIDQAEGKLVVGACAKVKYQVVNGQNRALEIDSEPARDCR
jgi:hypothetical protein